MNGRICMRRTNMSMVIISWFINTTTLFPGYTVGLSNLSDSLKAYCWFR